MSVLRRFLIFSALFATLGIPRISANGQVAESAAPAENLTHLLPEIPLDQLSDSHLTSLAKAALAIHPETWKHAETAHFIYHFHRNDVATPLSVEAESDYHYIATELGKGTAQWERKSHIFVFESREEWTAFQKKATLDPWTGGIHSGGDLFLLRDASVRWKGRTLAHEITHLLLARFVGADIPLWINEGFAEYAGTNAYAIFYRERGYLSLPRLRPIPAARYIPIASLTTIASYPENALDIAAFYAESHALVRFLIGTDKPQFLELLTELAEGARFETAFARTFGSHFSDIDTMEAAFKQSLIHDSLLTPAANADGH